MQDKTYNYIPKPSKSTSHYNQWILRLKPLNKCIQKAIKALNPSKHFEYLRLKPQLGEA